MKQIKLSVEEVFLALNCAFMAYTQLDDIELNSTTGTTKEARGAVFQILISSIKNGIGNDTKRKITLRLNNDECSALINLLLHGTHWFNPSLLIVDKSKATNLVRRIENEMTNGTTEA